MHLPTDNENETELQHFNHLINTIIIMDVDSVERICGVAHLPQTASPECIISRVIYSVPTITLEIVISLNMIYICMFYEYNMRTPQHSTDFVRSLVMV